MSSTKIQLTEKVNYKHDIPDTTQPFTVRCLPGTDIYDSAPDTHRFDAPILYNVIPFGKFKAAGVHVTGPWQQQYDQGGLSIVINLKDGSRKWLKIGLELYEGTPMMSVVVKDNWADWSLRPLVSRDKKSVEVCADADDHGNLWIYLVDDEGNKAPAREVTWWGALDDDAVQDLWVGISAAKPSTIGGELAVEYDGFWIESEQTRKA